jgi:PKD repeat protein
MKSHFSRYIFLKKLAVAAGFAFSACAYSSDSSLFIGMDLDQNRDLINTAMLGRNYMVQVDQAGKIKQVIDTGANGDGKDSQTLSSSSLTNINRNSDTFASADLPVSYQGQQAIDYIGADLDKVAANYGFTSEKLKEMLLHDKTMHIDSGNRILFVDHTIDQQAEHLGVSMEAASGVNGGSQSLATIPMATSTNLANAFKLHSKPGASKKLYLDFVGYDASNTDWTSNKPLIAPAFDLTGDPNVFDDKERNAITNIWARVAEDFIGFDIDVTTADPGNDALIRSSAADNNYGTRVVITKSGLIKCGCGGIAFVGMTTMINNTRYQPAWVFQQSLANNPKYIAEAISHEAGHTFGLLHDGLKQNNVVHTYYMGHGAGATSWAPIMGDSYFKTVTQWDHGLYPGANNQQNDILTFAANGLVGSKDDIGNTIATASSLNTTLNSGVESVHTYGVIGFGDIDIYSFNTGGGNINLAANPATVGANLDIQLSLFKPDGTQVASSDPSNSLSASINIVLPAGTYYLAIKASGKEGNGASDPGYPSYGSLGQYQISGSFPVGAQAVPPVADLSASSVSGQASLTVSFSANNSIGNGNILSYQWSFGDGTTASVSNPVHTYTQVGNYTASLTITNEYQLSDTKSVQITVTTPAHTVHASALNLVVIQDTSNNITGQVSVTVLDDQGLPVPNAVVNGSWTGAFSSSSSSSTDGNGVALQSSNTVPANGGGYGGYTINNITIDGYSYDPTENVNSAATVTW